MGATHEREARPVWSRYLVHTYSCPKSYITAGSVTLLEEYWAWKRVGGVSYFELEARSLEAFAILDAELLKEHSEQTQRHQSVVKRNQHIRSFGG